MKLVLNPLLELRFGINMVKTYGGSLLGLPSARDQCVPMSLAHFNVILHVIQ